jgi:predicted enzyme related to lactoylglutathione lyase
MTVRFQSVCVDCEDADALATFWAQVLGWERIYEDDEEIDLAPPQGSPEHGLMPDLLFLPVPEGKAVKNRLHIDLRPDDRDAEVARIEGFGARRVDVGQGNDVSWVVLADPEGNEFCVLRALKPGEAP